MSAKVVLVLCAQALLVQTTFAQCSFGWGGPGLVPGLGYDRFSGPFGYDRFPGPLAYDGLAPWVGRGFGCNAGYAPGIDITPTSSGGLIVTSSSPVAPTGISVISENAYEGILAVAGEVPFVGTTGMEGVVPTAGAAAVNHACGNGNNAMVSELSGYGAYGPAAYAPGIGPSFSPAFGPGIGISGIAPAIAPGYTGCGCGCGYLY